MKRAVIMYVVLALRRCGASRRREKEVERERKEEKKF